MKTVKQAFAQKGKAPIAGAKGAIPGAAAKAMPFMKGGGKKVKTVPMKKPSGKC